MKSAYVSDLTADQTVTSFFLVCAREVRATRDGKPYLRLELGDRTGTIEARMWDRFEEAARGIERDDIVKVDARVEVYRNRPQLALHRLRRAEPTEVDLADYLPHTRADVEALYAQLKDYAASLQNPWLRRLVTSIIEDPLLVPKLKRAPAAKVMHHAYLGGLLEHVVSLCGLCRVVGGHYADVDADLLLTGAILHDIGKLDELTYERSLGYTTEGQLLGHIVMEIETVNQKMNALEGFPPALRTLVQHLLISHHGQYEFGSPKLPMVREAVLLHHLDDLDSKLEAIRAALALTAGDDEWTAWSAALERKILRTDQFLKARAKSEKLPAQGELSLRADSAK